MYYTLLLGSNMGPSLEMLERARGLLSVRAGSVVRCSEVLRTEPVGEGVTGIFFNQALLLRSQLDPERMLDVLESIEREMGRSKPGITPGWDNPGRVFEDRLIDIDILLMGRDAGKMDLRYRSSRLCIPHMAVGQRPFVSELLSGLNIDC